MLQNTVAEVAQILQNIVAVVAVQMYLDAVKVAAAVVRVLEVGQNLVVLHQHQTN